MWTVDFVVDTVESLFLCVCSSGLGNIFIKGLDTTIDNKELHDAFSVFGTIISCKLVLDQQGNRVGRGFVHFARAEDAQKGIDS